MNNWRLRDGLIFLVWGIIIRNIIVIAGVLVWEKTSIEGLREAWRLSKRAFAIRRWLASSNRSARP
jgi:tryptophan-rich sensory protein